MSQIVLEHFHGASTRVRLTDTACTLRTPGFSVVCCRSGATQGQRKCIGWCKDTYAAMKPFLGSTRYRTTWEDDEPDDIAASVYGPNYPRLQELKAKYDPENVFHTNVNIRPRK